MYTLLAYFFVLCYTNVKNIYTYTASDKKHQMGVAKLNVILFGHYFVMLLLPWDLALNRKLPTLFVIEYIILLLSILWWIYAVIVVFVKLSKLMVSYFFPLVGQIIFSVWLYQTYGTQKYQLVKIMYGILQCFYLIFFNVFIYWKHTPSFEQVTNTQ